MRIFLFLYPIREYIDNLLKNWLLFSYNGHKVEEINEIIRVRYREQDFQIWWVVFSDRDDLSQPDFGRVYEFIEIQPQDVIVPCGVDFETHCQKRLYPNFTQIVSQLPQNLEKLVVAGFHQWDCVDKTAAAAHKRGINVFVDEDLTEHFFPGVGLGLIPLVRQNWSLTEIMGEHDEIWIDFALENRKDKPWFTQKP